jgi:GNAT superfamily N-acetyltransferase
MSEPVPSEQLSYRLTVSAFTDDLDATDEPSSFTTHWPFEVRQGDLLIARAHAVLFHVRQAERFGASLAEIFDSIDQDVHELFCTVYDEETGALRGDLVEASDLRDLLYIESVKVVPSHRGKKIGLRMVERMRDVLGGGCAAIALKAFPMTAERAKYHDAINHEVFSRPFAVTGEAAKAKLRSYWGRLGFERVGTTDYMLFDPSEDPPILELP